MSEGEEAESNTVHNVPKHIPIKPETKTTHLRLRGSVCVALRTEAAVCLNKRCSDSHRESECVPVKHCPNETAGEDTVETIQSEMIINDIRAPQGLEPVKSRLLYTH